MDGGNIDREETFAGGESEEREQTRDRSPIRFSPRRCHFFILLSVFVLVLVLAMKVAMLVGVV